jgi:acyl dehydratase
MAMPDFNNIQEGFEIPSLTKEPVTQVQLIKYAGASGDFNQIHTVPEYAKEAGLDGTIIHGMLIMGILGQLLTSWAPLKSIVKFGVSFKAMAKPGDTLKAKGVVKRKFQDEKGKFVVLKLQVEDAKGDVKVGGTATIKFN